MAVNTISEAAVIYGSRANGPVVATLYRPAGNALAAIVEAHGGAWTSGDRSMNSAIARHLAANGIAVLSLDFRMPPDAAYPETVTDVTAGVRWMKAHAGDVGTTAGRVGLLGTSSGGHLALLAGLRPEDPRYTGTVDAGSPDGPVDFVALGWPVSDPLARYRLMRDRNNTRLMDAHHAFWPGEPAMEDGSPVAIVARGDAQRLPALFIMQGTNDDNLTADMQQRLVAVYEAKGGRAELAVYEGEPHGFIARDPASAASQTALADLTAFILREAGVTGQDGSPRR